MTDAAAPAASSEDGASFPWAKVVLGIAVVAAIVAAYSLLPLKEWIESFQDWVKGLGALGVIVFILVYAVATLLLFPGALLTVAGGVIWGLWALPIVLAGAVLGAALSFLAARYLFRDKVESKMARYPKFKAVNQAIGDEGWKVIALLRLSPAIPFSAQNWFLGVTPVGFVPSMAATAVAIIPGTLLYVWIGSLGGADSGGGPLKAVFFGVGLVATAVVTWLVTRKAKAKLEAIRGGAD